MAAATVRGEVVLGAIHDPVCGDTALALRGEGAWLQGDTAAKADLRVAAAVPVSKMDAIAGTNFLPEPLSGTVGRNLPKLAIDRKSVVEGKSVSVRVDLGGHRIMTNQIHNITMYSIRVQLKHIL